MKGPLDGRSDIYALGVLAFELFTGELPFRGKSAQEMMIARLKGKPTAVGSCVLRRPAPRTGTACGRPPRARATR